MGAFWGKNIPLEVGSLVIGLGFYTLGCCYIWYRVMLGVLICL